ncbi:MAG: lytic transglycosylase domain-containing protein [Thermoanaerobaculia bacterium]
MVKHVLCVGAGASLLVAALSARADVHLVRKSDGSALIYNEVGSGWLVDGRAPSDSYLMERRLAASPWDEAIREAAGRHGVDQNLVKSVMLVESNFNVRAVSRKGARGLMQLMPETARRFRVTDRFDAAENIRGGVAYLAALLRLFSGDIVRTVAAYNAGESAVARHAGIPPFAETREYVRRVLVAMNGAPARPLGGGFRGLTTSPAAPAARSKTAPVRVAYVNGTRILTNTDNTDRVGPLLGRTR